MDKIHTAITSKILTALKKEGWIFDSDRNARKTDRKLPLKIECLGGSCLTDGTLVQISFNGQTVTLPAEESTAIREAFKEKYLDMMKSPDTYAAQRMFSDLNDEASLY